MAPPQLSACARATAAASRFVSSSFTLAAAAASRFVSASLSPAAAKKPVVLALAAPSKSIKKPARPASCSRCVTAPSSAAAKSSPSGGHRTAASAAKIVTAPSTKPPAGTTSNSARANAGSEFMAPRGATTAHPARRLASGTAVRARTAFVPANVKCRILLWLPARVVAAYGASHYTVKYAADLNPMFAGKVARLPAEHVREAPRRPPDAAATATASRP
ncbi:hypothetical protein ACP70R_025841 [Stipagrostis hirtigluma subsp. patula]